jgi:hypothetical protein
MKKGTRKENEIVRKLKRKLEIKINNGKEGKY